MLLSALTLGIWIQSDGTEVGVANELVEAGVPQKDIVLGFKSPSSDNLPNMLFANVINIQQGV